MKTFADGSFEAIEINMAMAINHVLRGEGFESFGSCMERHK